MVLCASAGLLVGMLVYLMCCLLLWAVTLCCFWGWCLLCLFGGLGSVDCSLVGGWVVFVLDV